MIKPGQKIKVLCNGKNRDHYIAKGYVDPDIKHNIILYVDVEDLPQHSHKKILVICDLEDCGCEFSQEYSNYNLCHDEELGDFCTRHAYRKALITTERLYGDKIATRIPQFKDKTRITNLNKYGTPSPMQNNEIKKKLAASFREKYGVDNPSLSREIQEKRKQTCKERYGAENVFLLSEYQHKARVTMSQNRVNGVMTSKPLQRLFDLLSKHYNNIDHDIEVDRYSLDIMLNINGCKIDIEYDGWYWHREDKVVQKDLARQEILSKEYNIKTLRVKGGQNIPDIEILKEKINKIISGSEYEEIILAEWKLLS